MLNMSMCEIHVKAKDAKPEKRNIFIRELYFSNWNLLHLCKCRKRCLSRHNVFVIFIYWWHSWAE